VLGLGLRLRGRGGGRGWGWGWHGEGGRWGLVGGVVGEVVDVRGGLGFRFGAS